MENIKFIKSITEYIPMDGVVAGNCVYYGFDNGNRAKVYCEQFGVVAEIINKLDGKVDKVNLPFANYFAPKQCSPGAPKWSQHIDGGKWYFAHYEWCLPTQRDYMNMAEVIMSYLELYM